MSTTTTVTNPSGLDPVTNQPKLYFPADVEAAGGMDAFMKSIGSDRAKLLPEIDFSEDEWRQMLNAEL